MSIATAASRATASASAISVAHQLARLARGAARARRSAGRSDDRRRQHRAHAELGPARARRRARPVELGRLEDVGDRDRAPLAHCRFDDGQPRARRRAARRRPRPTPPAGSSPARRAGRSSGRRRSRSPTSPSDRRQQLVEVAPRPQLGETCAISRSRSSASASALGRARALERERPPRRRAPASARARPRRTGAAWRTAPKTTPITSSPCDARGRTRSSSRRAIAFSRWLTTGERSAS